MGTQRDWAFVARVRILENGKSQAYCSCGWVSSPVWGNERAKVDAWLHRQHETAIF